MTAVRRPLDLMVHAAVATESGLVGWRVERLRAALDGPLVLVASGGTRAAAVLWARLHERWGRPAWVQTPYDLQSRPVPADARVLVLSISGRHHDTLSTARKVAGRVPTYGVTCDRSAPLVGVIRDGREGNDAVVLPRGEGPAAVVPMLVMAARMYSGVGPFFPLFANADARSLPAEPPRQLVCAASGFGAPAATLLAARSLDSGFAPARTTDLRSLAAAELASFDPQRDCLALFAAGSEQRTYADRFEGRWPGGGLLRFEAESHDAEGAIRLVAEVAVTLDARELWAEARLPAWALRLSRLVVDEAY